MAINQSTITDSAGQYEDWIELYNNGSQAVDLSGYWLTDNAFNLRKWQMPAGTTILPNEYLIIWADEDGGQGDYHCNFKLSASGEDLLLINPSGQLVDEVVFGQQTADQGYARVPNGTGPFVIQDPTFGANNNLVRTSPHWMLPCDCSFIRIRPTAMSPSRARIETANSWRYTTWSVVPYSADACRRR